MKVVIQPMSQADWYALRDGIDLAIAHLEEQRVLRRHRLFGLQQPGNGRKGPLERRLENLQKNILGTILEV